MFQIIDRYIIKQFLGYFAGSLIVFSSLFLAIDFMTNLAKYSASADVFLAYYLLMTPSIMYQLLPIAFIMGAIFTLTNLNKNNELVALFSSGMSLARISLPILLSVAFISFFSFFIADMVIPKLEHKKDQIYYHKIKKKPWLMSTVKSDKIWFRSENRLFNLRSFSSSQSSAQGLTLYYFDEAWNLLQIIRAKDIAMKTGQWLLKDGSVTVFEEISPFPIVKKFAEKSIGVSEAFSVLDSDYSQTELMTTGQLSEFIEKNKAAGIDTVEYEVSLHQKISYAFAGLVLVLMGIPFCVGHARSGSFGKNIGVCILIVFIYWVLYSSFINFGKHGVFPPLIAAWAPNLLFFGFAIHLLVCVKK